MAMDERIKNDPDEKAPLTHHFLAADGQSVEIRDVWASNLEEEMEKIREIIEKYPYVAMVLLSLRHLPPSDNLHNRIQNSLVLLPDQFVNLVQVIINIRFLFHSFIGLLE
jgi:hypothetical protein